MPTPANISLVGEFQDNRGFRALTRINLFTLGIANGDPPTGIVTMTLGSLFLLVGSGSSSIFGRLAAMSNAKLVRQGVQIDFQYAQEPTSETGQYQLVKDKAHLSFGDGNGGFQHISVPAPIDALFLTTADNNLVTVDPAAPTLTALQAALAANTAQAAVSAENVGPFLTARDGIYGSQFFGGQLVGGKPRRRRVLQGQ